MGSLEKLLQLHQYKGLTPGFMDVYRLGFVAIHQKWYLSMLEMEGPEISLALNTTITCDIYLTAAEPHSFNFLCSKLFPFLFYEGLNYSYHLISSVAD